MPSSTPRKPLLQLAEKKCPRVLAHVPVMHARGKLHYGIISRATLSRQNSQYSDLVDSQPTAQIFIDFEGNKDSPPTLLGVLERTATGEKFHQYILEDVFNGLVPSDRHPQLRVNTLAAILREIDKNHGPNIPIYAWSSHEQEVINRLLADTDLSTQWTDRIIDAKKLAKRWARAEFPEHKFEKTEFRGRHTLDQYLDLIKYNVPTVHGPGKTGARLTSLRKTLLKGQPFESWPRSKKTYWTNLLAHNMHDCFGMMSIIDRVTADTKP